MSDRRSSCPTMKSFVSQEKPQQMLNQQLSSSKTLSKSQQVLRIDSNASCQMSDECASVIQTYSQQVPTILPHSIWFSILITLILIRNKSSATYFTNRMFLLQSTLWSDQSSCHSYHRGPISKGHMESVQGYKSMGHWDWYNTLAIALLSSSIDLEKWFDPNTIFWQTDPNMCQNTTLKDNGGRATWK